MTLYQPISDVAITPLISIIKSGFWVHKHIGSLWLLQQMFIHNRQSIFSRACSLFLSCEPLRDTSEQLNLNPEPWPQKRAGGKLRLLDGDGVCGVGEHITHGDVYVNKQSPLNTRTVPGCIYVLHGIR